MIVNFKLIRGKIISGLLISVLVLDSNLVFSETIDESTSFISGTKSHKILNIYFVSNTNGNLIIESEVIEDNKSIVPEVDSSLYSISRQKIAILCDSQNLNSQYKILSSSGHSVFRLDGRDNKNDYSHDYSNDKSLKFKRDPRSMSGTSYNDVIDTACLLYAK